MPKNCDEYCKNDVSERRKQESSRRIRSEKMHFALVGWLVTGNFASDAARLGRELSENTGGTKHQPHDPFRIIW